MRRYLRFLSEVPVLIILFIAGAGVDVFAFIGIQKIPKPEGLMSTITYYFHLPQEYITTIILSIIAFLLTAAFGIGLLVQVTSWEEYYPIVRNILIFISVLIIIFSLYFISYFLFLLFCLIIIGLIVIGIMKLNDK